MSEQCEYICATFTVCIWCSYHYSDCSRSHWLRIPSLQIMQICKMELRSCSDIHTFCLYWWSKLRAYASTENSRIEHHWSSLRSFFPFCKFRIEYAPDCRSCLELDIVLHLRWSTIWSTWWNLTRLSQTPIIGLGLQLILRTKRPEPCREETDQSVNTNAVTPR